MPAKKDRTKKVSDFTVFQADSRFRGILKFGRPLQILGKFDGEIYGKALLEVGSSAEITADIECEHVVIYGKVTGNVAASEKVELRQGARLTGNIRSPKLEIDDGVVFEGQCEMQKTPESTPENQQAKAG